MAAVKEDGLRVEGLGCRYDKYWIFRDLTFSVKPGEAVAVIGQSGAGKTTLAYCLVGITPNKIKAEVEGKVLVEGRNVLTSRIRENVKLINIVMQNYEMQIFGLTVEEDLAFGLENLGLDDDVIKSRVEWALETFGLSKYRAYYVHELSGGLRQRLAIASSVITAPKYLVMDDPTANLDWKGILELNGTIQKLKRDGRGIIVMARRLKGLEKSIDKIIRLNTQRSSAPPMNDQMKYSKKSDENGPAVIFENVWFRYARDYVLRGVNLEISKGECVALMGPNGSGKTTLVKHVNGLLKPVRGRVLVLGRDTREYSVAQLAKYVGFVFQDPDKHVTCETVWDEVMFGPRNLGLDERYAEEALKTLGLLDRRNDPPYLLSMGEKIRVSIAGSLSMNPEILILDEPTTGQDEETLAIISAVINRLKSSGKTVLVVTHDSDFALSISDRVIAMRDGVVAADGAPREILLNESVLSELGLEPPSVLLESEAAEVLMYD